MKKFLLILIVIQIMFSINAINKDKITILTLKATNIDQSIADAVTDNFITEVINLNIYNVIETTQLKAVLDELNINIQNELTNSQILDIGRKTQVKIIFLGTVSKLGVNYTLNTRGISIETGEIILSKNAVARTDDSLVDATKSLARAIGADYFKVKQENTIVTEDTSKTDIIEEKPVEKPVIKKEKIIEENTETVKPKKETTETVKKEVKKPQVDLLKNKIFIKKKTVSKIGEFDIYWIDEKLKPFKNIIVEAQKNAIEISSIVITFEDDTELIIEKYFLIEDGDQVIIPFDNSINQKISDIEFHYKTKKTSGNNEQAQFLLYVN